MLRVYRITVDVEEGQLAAPLRGAHRLLAASLQRIVIVFLLVADFPPVGVKVMRSDGRLHRSPPDEALGAKGARPSEADLARGATIVA